MKQRTFTAERPLGRKGLIGAEGVRLKGRFYNRVEKKLG